MKKKMALALAAALLLAAGIWAALALRQAAYDDGRAAGYLAGYAMGLNGLPQGDSRNGQQLAGEIVPYEVGGSKWKGFMIGFPEGWDDGRQAAEAGG